jgi:hypothetical protein
MTPDMKPLVAPLVKPLDLSNVMKHAFLSGIVAARNIPGYEEINGPELWVAYDPQPNPAYDRIVAALDPAALAAMLADAEQRGREAAMDAIPDEIGLYRIMRKATGRKRIDYARAILAAIRARGPAQGGGE